MNGLTRNGAYLAAAVLAALVATLFIWPDIWSTPRGRTTPGLRDTLIDVAVACVGLMYLRLLYVAAASTGPERRAAIVACIAIAFFGFVVIFGSIVVLVGTTGGAA
jgi:hypothetical protein